MGCRQSSGVATTAAQHRAGPPTVGKVGKAQVQARERQAQQLLRQPRPVAVHHRQVLRRGGAARGWAASVLAAAGTDRAARPQPLQEKSKRGGLSWALPAPTCRPRSWARGLKWSSPEEHCTDSLARRVQSARARGRPLERPQKSSCGGRAGAGTEGSGMQGVSKHAAPLEGCCLEGAQHPPPARAAPAGAPPWKETPRWPARCRCRRGAGTRGAAPPPRPPPGAATRPGCRPPSARTSGRGAWGGWVGGVGWVGGWVMAGWGARREHGTAHRRLRLWRAVQAACGPHLMVVRRSISQARKEARCLGKSGRLRVRCTQYGQKKEARLVTAAPKLGCKRRGKRRAAAARLGEERQAVEVEVGQQAGLQRHPAPPGAHGAHGLAPAGAAGRERTHGTRGDVAARRWVAAGQRTRAAVHAGAASLQTHARVPVLQGEAAKHQAQHLSRR